jgi:hypothetical protein
MESPSVKVFHALATFIRFGHVAKITIHFVVILYLIKSNLLMETKHLSYHFPPHGTNY